MFLGPLILEALPNPDYWAVRAPLVWCDALYGRIEVPPGFVTDLASIPRALRNLPSFDPNGLSRRPAVVHDWLYATQTLTKPTADGFLHDAMLLEGCSQSDAQAFYDAVHWFGQAAWDDDLKRGVAASFSALAEYQVWLAANSISRTVAQSTPLLPVPASP